MKAILLFNTYNCDDPCHKSPQIIFNFTKLHNNMILSIIT